MEGNGQREGADFAFRLRTRGDLTSFLTALSDGVGADAYMLLAVPGDRRKGQVRVLASNWVFDAIELVGQGLLGRLVASPFTTAPGTRPQPIAAAHAPDLGGVLSGEEARLLHVLNHAEIWALRVQAGARRFFLLLSGALPGAIDPEALVRAQLECGYALGQAPNLVAAAAADNPLSERERECLFWVSQGKTTPEVAMILSVAANTVNSYMTHAMQKLSAANRQMAVATAIRAGII